MCFLVETNPLSFQLPATMSVPKCILLLVIACGCNGQDIEPTRHEVYALAGSNITLSCTYLSAVSLQWYRQDPGSAPQFLLLVMNSAGTATPASNLDPRYSAKRNDDKTRLDLKISSVEVTDSALYYCATNDGFNKLIFGAGTNLMIDSKEHSDPKYYKLNDTGTTACLATDFSTHKATTSLPLPWGDASRVKGDKYYSQVALMNKTHNCTEGNYPVKHEDGNFLPSDPKTNFLSLTILGLRILFLKTIIFNVLMTLRLWIS